jgi:hypothetical protein
MVKCIVGYRTLEIKEEMRFEFGKLQHIDGLGAVFVYGRRRSRAETLEESRGKTEGNKFLNAVRGRIRQCVHNQGRKCF